MKTEVFGRLDISQENFFESYPSLSEIKTYWRKIPISIQESRIVRNSLL